MKTNNLHFRSMIKEFKNKKILVIGDLIIDRYYIGVVTGKSSESPTLVMTINRIRDYFGGAGAVATQIASLGASVYLSCFFGIDLYSKIAMDMARFYNVNIRPTISFDRPTNVKKRYVADNYKLLRVNTIESQDIPSKIEGRAIQSIKNVFSENKFDAVIISDFNCGFVTEKILKLVSSYCRKKGIFIAGDCQSNSTIGNVLKFKGFNLITPTRREAQIALRDHTSSDENLAKAIKKKTKSQAVILTLGSEGMIYDNGKIWFSFPAVRKDFVDTSGAGDAMLGAFVLCLKSSMTYREAAEFSSHVAAVKIMKHGNEPAFLNEITESIKRGANNENIL